MTILEEILSVSGKRLRRAAAVCIGLSVLATGGASAAVTLSDETETAIYLAELLRSARTVIANHQAHINDPAVGDKGLTGKVVLAKTRETFRQRTGKPLPLKDENDLRTRLLRAQLASIREVMDENQRTINRTGIGFKGFVPAVFARLVNERFREKAGDYAEVKVTAPMSLVRNRRARPDSWERSNIREKLMAEDWPVGRIYTEAATNSGRTAFRVLEPFHQAGTLDPSRQRRRPRPAAVPFDHGIASGRSGNRQRKGVGYDGVDLAAARMR